MRPPLSYFWWYCHLSENLWTSCKKVVHVPGMCVHALVCVCGLAADLDVEYSWQSGELRYLHGQALDYVSYMLSF